MGVIDGSAMQQWRARQVVNGALREQEAMYQAMRAAQQGPRHGYDIDGTCEEVEETKALPVIDHRDDT